MKKIKAWAVFNYLGKIKIVCFTKKEARSSLDFPGDYVRRITIIVEDADDKK